MALKDLGHDFEGRSIQIIEVGRRYQLRTRPAYTETVAKIFSDKPRSLSKSAIETLAIVAYRQPVTRAEITALRQVDSSHLVSSLKEKELIYASGTRKEAGHPVEYKTSPKFLDVFGLAGLDDLPRLRSLQMSADEVSDVKKALAQIDAGESSDDIVPPTANDLHMIDEEILPDDADHENIVASQVPAKAESLASVPLPPQQRPHILFAAAEDDEEDEDKDARENEESEQTEQSMEYEALIGHLATREEVPPSLPVHNRPANHPDAVARPVPLALTPKKTRTIPSVESLVKPVSPSKPPQEAEEPAT